MGGAGGNDDETLSVSDENHACNAHALLLLNVALRKTSPT